MNVTVWACVFGAVGFNFLFAAVKWGVREVLAVFNSTQCSFRVYP